MGILMGKSKFDQIHNWALGQLMKGESLIGKDGVFSPFITVGMDYLKGYSEAFYQFFSIWKFRYTLFAKPVPHSPRWPRKRESFL